MIVRRAFMALSMAAVLCAGIVRPGMADTVQDSRAFIQRLADTAMSTVAIKGLPDDERTRRFRTLFVDAFDMQDVGKWVLGRYWKAATPDQQQEFLRLFEDIQVYTWSRRFRDYSGETLEILSTNTENDGEVTVSSRINREKLDPIGVVWRVRKVGDAYKVSDIKVEGASMAITHRSEYASVIQGNGGQVESLLVSMRRKVTALQSEQSADAAR